MDRRRFLQSLAVVATAPALSWPGRAADASVGPLLPDPGRILDLPDGYSYTVVSRAGDLMSDGLRVPRAHDGMAAFTGIDGRINLVCNHEIGPANFDHGAFADAYPTLAQGAKGKVYDHGGGRTPGAGGTTTTVYNPQTGQTERQHLSLAGTELNCAGGPTPWGSWLSAEECFESAGWGWSAGRIVEREQPHGYVFEVPALHEGLVEPVPIKAMGRFEHEAAAVHEQSGIVYLTEDRHYSLFYRYLPDVPGRLAAGGRLQCLAIDGRPSLATHNWTRRPQVNQGEPLPVRWIDLDDVDPDENNLRLRGAKRGAATFARGEGLTAAGEDFVFTCTIGGAARLGQIFSYRPSPHEGQPAEHDAPGQLTLIGEATRESMLRNCDNLTIAPWGDLVVCEDLVDIFNHSRGCSLVGVRPDGSQYLLASNAYTNSELAGVCFSPDGQTLFVNIQRPGMTVAITGPFPT